MMVSKRTPQSGYRLVLIGGALLAATIACARTSGPQSLAEADLVQGSLEHDGLERTYLYWAPEGARERRESLPLVLILHGGNGDSLQACTQAGGIGQIARQEGSMVACPQAIEGHWNDGRQIQKYRAQREGVNDEGFLLTPVDTLAAEFHVDRDAVFVIGASNGGMMTYRMACGVPGEFAAAAAMIANLPLDGSCDPGQPISMMIMNGTEDPLMPYEGGQVQFLNQELGGVHSTDETVRFWARANGCDQQPNRELLEDVAPQDGTRIQRLSYPNCDGGVATVLYQVQGGGHTLPGGTQYAGERLIGPVSQDAHAGEMAWAFFEGTME